MEDDAEDDTEDAGYHIVSKGSSQAAIDDKRAWLRQDNNKNKHLDLCADLAGKWKALSMHCVFQYHMCTTCRDAPVPIRTECSAWPSLRHSYPCSTAQELTS